VATRFEFVEIIYRLTNLLQIISMKEVRNGSIFDEIVDRRKLGAYVFWTTLYCSSLAVELSLP